MALVIGAVVLAVLFFATVLVPLIAFTIELALLVILFLAGMTGRLLFRRPLRLTRQPG